MLILASTAVLSQVTIDPKLRDAAQEVQSDHVYDIHIFIDNTSNKTTQDIEEVVAHVNQTYFQAKIHFNLMYALYGEDDYNPSGDILTSVQSLPKTNSIIIFVTGHSKGIAIGAEQSNSILVNLQGDNKTCSRLLAHELGHLFGLQHGNDSDYIMSKSNNQDYSNKFTKENLFILKNL